MDAFLIEAVPAAAARSLAEALQILFCVIHSDSVLARNVEDLLLTCPSED
jgi:hypothetical protein